MRHSIRLGKLFGIEIDIDLSWLLIFALVTWSLAEYYLAANQGWSAGLRWSLAIATSLVFFGSVLLHELGHSLVSQSQGIPVPRITLFIFGGVSQISHEPRRARDEFWMALAGPLVSLGLAVVFGLIWLLTRTASPPLAVMAGWLAAINASLAIFNLLPAFPLDGGRVLRAVIWGITNNLGLATKVAVGSGVLLSWLMIAIGLWQVFGGDWADGLWTAFIGWFLESAAIQEGQVTAVHDLLKGHTVREMPLTDAPHVFKQMTLDVFFDNLATSGGRRCFAVMDDDQFLGLMTMHWLQEAPRSQWSTTHVADVMIPPERLTTARMDEDLSDVLDAMGQADVNQLPVLENGRLLGMVTRGSIVAFLQNLAERRKGRPGSQSPVLRQGASV